MINGGAETRVPLDEVKERQKSKALEFKEGVDGKYPAVIVAFIRSHNFFRPEKEQRNNIDAEDFLDYVQKRLQSELHLEIGKLELEQIRAEKLKVEQETGDSLPESWSPAHALGSFTKEHVSIVDALIGDLEESGYIQKDSIQHHQKVKAPEEIESIMVPLQAAVMQAASDYEKLSLEFRAEVETNKQNVNWA
jgi:DNA-directed RNA polymerase specialized sigma54-like protein